MARAGSAAHNRGKKGGDTERDTITGIRAAGPISKDVLGGSWEPREDLQEIFY